MRRSKQSIWKHFMKSLPLTLLAIMLAVVGTLAATGTIDSPAAPGSTSSYTLEDLYQRLVNGTAGTQSSFTEPSAAPGTGTMHDINALMAAAPEADTNGATTADVLPGKTFWGLTNGEWGEQIGNMALGSNFTGADGLLTFDVPDGYYSGVQATAYDADLLAGNILDTVDIFGVTGSIPTQGDVTGADGSVSIVIPTGYYPGNTATASDVDLIAQNIKAGVTIFGVTGIYQSGWFLHTTTSEGTILNAVDMVSSTDGWAVGEYGRIYHFDGSTWNLYTTMGSSIYALDMVSSTDGWAVGESGRIYHWYGTDWSLYSAMGMGSAIWSVDMIRASDGWAVGEDGFIYHWNGTWSLHTDTAASVLYAVDMVSSTDGWAVGESGHIYRLSGTTWNLHTTTAEGTRLSDVFMVSSTDGWAVGNGGLIYHWNGSAWSLHTDTAASVLNAVAMVSSTEGWAVGYGGQIYHYDGGTWSLHTTTAEGSTLLAVSVISDTEAWAVGNYGHIYIGDD